jgi:acetyltransferase-like isoleucine patch superfamily enzyme
MRTVKKPEKPVRRGKGVIVYAGVKLPRGANLEDYVVLGVLPKGARKGSVKTVFGINAVIRSHSVVYAGNRMGDNFFAGHGVLIREFNEIGDDVSIGSHTVVEHHVRIGNRVRIHSNAFIPELSILEEGCWIGPNVVITNAPHPLCPKVKECMKGPTIRSNAKIGANVTILPDLVIGENSLIGAGSVVIGDIPPNVVATGNPARVVKNIDEITCPYELIEKPY